MISAEEAKRTSRENKIKIEAEKLERIIKDVEDRIWEAIDCGYGFIRINSELSCFYEVVDHFNDLGYEALSVYVMNNKRTYIVWDEESWIKELGFEGKTVLREGELK